MSHFDRSSVIKILKILLVKEHAEQRLFWYPFVWLQFSTFPRLVLFSPMELWEITNYIIQMTYYICVMYNVKYKVDFLSMINLLFWWVFCCQRLVKKNPRWLPSIFAFPGRPSPPSVILEPLSSIILFTSSSSSVTSARVLDRSWTPPLACRYFSFVSASTSCCWRNSYNRQGK